MSLAVNLQPVQYLMNVYFLPLLKYYSVAQKFSWFLQNKRVLIIYETVYAIA